MLGTCPILSHQSNCLYNWRRVVAAKMEEGEEEKEGGMNGSSSNCSGDGLKDGSSTGSSAVKTANSLLQAKDLALTFSFTGDGNERMFYLLTLEIEAVGAQALPLLEEARRTAQLLFLVASSKQQKKKKEEEIGKLLQHQQKQQQEEEEDEETQHQQQQNHHCQQHQQQQHQRPQEQQQQQSQEQQQQQQQEEEEQIIINALTQVRAYIQGCQSILLSMPRFVDPAFFYHRVRPYLSGWKNNPTLPEGVVYRGVVLKEGEEEKGGGEGGEAAPNGNTKKEKVQGENENPKQEEEEGPRLHFSGGSAAQSSLLPSLDLYLGVNHNETGKASQSSYKFLKEMRVYMPKGHRCFLQMLEEEVEDGREDRVSIRRYVLWRCEGGEEGREGGREEGLRLRKAYDGCVEALVAFRKSHLGIVHLYITQPQQQQQQQLQQQEGGREGGKKGGGGLEEAAGGKGTGGQAPREFLEPLREQTAAAQLEGKTRLV